MASNKISTKKAMNSPIVVAVQRRKNNIAGKEKGREKHEALALEKSGQAWLLMNAKVVLPLLQFVKDNTTIDKIETFKKKNSLYDITRMSKLAKPILIKLKTGNKRRINYIFNKVRIIRNELAHHVNLHKRTIKTYLNYANVWGKVLDFIGRQKEKQELLASIRKMNSSKMKAARINKRRPQAAATERQPSRQRIGSQFSITPIDQRPEQPPVLINN